MFLQKENGHWTKIQKKETFSWIFSRSGLCEPLTMRFTLENSDFEFSFDELTAAVK